MRASTLLTGAVALYSAASVLALPTMMPDLSAEEMLQFRELADRIAKDFKIRDAEHPHAERADAFTGVKVETTGDHAYQPPKPGDLRGPCPGLNILANYGYINRNGYDTTVNIILASNKVFGMGIDLATFIAGYCAVMAGDVLTLSIGGPPPASLVTSLLGKRAEIRNLFKPSNSKRQLGLEGIAGSTGDIAANIPVAGSPPVALNFKFSDDDHGQGGDGGVGLAGSPNSRRQLLSGVVGGLTGATGGTKSPLGGALTSLLGNGGLVGSPKGLDWSHYRFEADVSPTRNDIWYNNDASSVHIERFTSLYNRGLQTPGKGGYDLTVLTPHRQYWTRNSIANNPYFWSGPFTNLAVTTATYCFTYRLFANYTTGSLDGYLGGEALKSWEGVTGEPGSFKFTYGSERIPENWYRRPLSSPYGVLEFTADALWTIQQVPDLAAFGGNTGTVNSFVGLNVTDITSGVLSAGDLLKGNNALCFAFATVSEFLPDLTRGLLKNAVLAVSQITGALTPILTALNCPDLSRMDAVYYDQFPAGRNAI